MSFSVGDLSRRRFIQAGLAVGAVSSAPSLMGAGFSTRTAAPSGLVTAEQAAQRVLAMASESVQLGSKGVGGLILDNRYQPLRRPLEVAECVRRGPVLRSETLTVIADRAASRWQSAYQEQ